MLFKTDIRNNWPPRAVLQRQPRALIGCRNSRSALWLVMATTLAVTNCNRNAAPAASARAASPTAIASPTSAPTSSPQIIGSPPRGLIATLADETSDLPDGQMAWTTYWRLCWQVYPGAIGYELETMTGEGAARKLRRQTETCFRVEVAKGRNEKRQGLFNRDLMLASISGQLSYRVRAVLDGNRVSQWSALMEAGRPSANAANAPIASGKTAPLTR